MVEGEERRWCSGRRRNMAVNVRKGCVIGSGWTWVTGDCCLDEDSAVTWDWIMWDTESGEVVEGLMRGRPRGGEGGSEF